MASTTPIIDHIASQIGRDPAAAPDAIHAPGYWFRAQPPGLSLNHLSETSAGETALDKHRNDVYCEYYNSNPDPESIYLTMLRTSEHKLIVAHGADTGELYDLRTDPGETHNLWDDPEHTEVKMELLIRLCARMAWTADPLPPRIGLY